MVKTSPVKNSTQFDEIVLKVGKINSSFFTSLDEHDESVPNRNHNSCSHGHEDQFGADAIPCVEEISCSSVAPLDKSQKDDDR